jgi:C-terminal processing protease CtpA/Prc
LRRELELAKKNTVEVELESMDGSTTKCVELPLVKERPIYGLWPRLKTEITSWKDILPESRILKSNIGYLRIVTMSSEPKFLDGLVEAMDRFRSTDGLIIDLRSNGGGRRTPLRVLLPFFMAPDDPPRIVNVASHRLGTKNIREDFKARYLHSASSSRWSKAEREVVGRFTQTFKPEWTPPKGQFSPWHYFVISPTKDERYYHYNKPVVILMNSGNFSACDIFLGAFKGLKNVTLMGRPSGGGSGCTQEYQLSNSGIRIYLSRMASFQPNGKLYDGNGLQPDVIVEPVPTDFIDCSDTVLDKAIQTINEKNNSLHVQC